jgi:integrase
MPFAVSVVPALTTSQLEHWASDTDRAIADEASDQVALRTEVVARGQPAHQSVDMAIYVVELQQLREDVPHGVRSTFRDWAAEQTPHLAWVAEAALAHVVADKVERAYRRGELIDKRRALMNDWAAYCCKGAEVMKTKLACVGTETAVASHGGVESH